MTAPQKLVLTFPEEKAHLGFNPLIFLESDPSCMVVFAPLLTKITPKQKRSQVISTNMETRLGFGT